MEYQDYYKRLGVSNNADEKEIKKAFRKLARQFHPDVNPGDKDAEKHFKELNEAYEVLSDADKRAKYDQLGSNYQQWQRSGGQGGFNWGDFSQSGGGTYRTDYGGGAEFFDLFGSFFCRRGNAQGRIINQPLRRE